MHHHLNTRINKDWTTLNNEVRDKQTTGTCDIMYHVTPLALNILTYQAESFNIRDFRRITLFYLFKD